MCRPPPPKSHAQVHSPFQMLNIINFLVFRVTRAVLYSLEAVLAPTPALTVSMCRQPARVIRHWKQLVSQGMSGSRQACPG